MSIYVRGPAGCRRELGRNGKRRGVINKQFVFQIISKVVIHKEEERSFE